MTKLLIRLFVKSPNDTKSPATRHAYGKLSSVTGIIVNLLLAALKLLAGVLTLSVSITADAVNNLSDAGSQLISFISFKIASKPADREHPFGHARIEYVASMIVSFIILTISIELLKSSVEKIINPVPTTLGTLSIVILAISILAKLWLAIFNRTIGKRINSSIILATSTDSLSDMLSTSAVLLSLLITRFTGFVTDGYIGVAVSVLIFVAGVKILIDTKNSILGGPPEKETVDGILRIASEYPEILGIHDMVVHSYGAGTVIASLHAEVDGSENVFTTHDVIDNLEARLFSELGVRATVHMDPIVTDDERVTSLRTEVLRTVRQIDERLSIHDFRLVEGVTHSNLLFDVVAPFELKMSDKELKRSVSDAISKINPSYFAVITIDRA